MRDREYHPTEDIRQKGIRHELFDFIVLFVGQRADILVPDVEDV